MTVFNMFQKTKLHISVGNVFQDRRTQDSKTLDVLVDLFKLFFKRSIKGPKAKLVSFINNSIKTANTHLKLEQKQRIFVIFE